MSSFEREFLDHYLRLGLGSMPKSDIDALVMHLLDKYGLPDSAPLAQCSHQLVSQRLRTPVAKIKKLRYEAALKFGGNIEDQAKARLLAALRKAVLEPEENKICLIIEDALAKDWLQGKLKEEGQIFDHSFNSEIIKVDTHGLLEVLAMLFNAEITEQFKKDIEKIKIKKNRQQKIRLFKEASEKFAIGAAQAAGYGVAKALQLYSGV